MKTSHRCAQAARTLSTLATLFCAMLMPVVAQSATIFFQTSATGSGIQSTYMPTNSISGTMTALVPRFNAGLGTLIQADFEWSATVNGSWTSIGNPIGNATIGISGPSDVGGQAMGILAPSFVDTYNTLGPSTSSDTKFTNITFTSGPFFNSLTGVGSETMTYTYSGGTSLDTPAIGLFDWGGTVHVLYTFVPVPEPGTLSLAALAACVLLAGRKIGLTFAKRPLPDRSHVISGDEQARSVG